jgi:hypothetical protein
MGPDVTVPPPEAGPAAGTGVATGPAAALSPMSWPQLLHSVEIVLLAAVASFLGSLATPGGTWTTDHLIAGGIAAGIAAAYRLSAILQTFVGGNNG